MRQTLRLSGFHFLCKDYYLLIQYLGLERFTISISRFRNDIIEDYKANRSDAPDDLIPQFEYIRKSVEAFNIPAVEMINYEADDLIATYSKQITKLGSDVTIVSSDKDLMQLYKKNVRIYDPMKNKFITDEDVNCKFGVTPEQVIAVQSLAGDSRDNVPGVPGICLLYTSPSTRDRG